MSALRLVRYGLFGVLGLVCATAGVTTREWQLYVILLVAAVACEIRALEVERKP